MLRAGATIIALALLLSGCAPKTAKPVLAASAAHRTPLEQLQFDLKSIFTSAEVDNAFWGVSVRSLKNDELLFSMNASRMQTPASNQKLITAAVAADKLGWDFRYTTKIYAIGPQEGGELSGDLVIVSNGDPSINPRHPDRWNVFDAWAKELFAKGLRRVNGHLIGDDNAFAEPGWGVGWAWDDLSLGYGAAVGALQYNENQIELRINPGIEPGASATITPSPRSDDLILTNSVSTAPAGQSNSIAFDRVPGSNMLTVRGQVAIGSPITLLAAAPNPTLLYLDALRQALARNGVEVFDVSLDVDDALVKPDYSRATLLLEDRSAPLSSIIDVNLKWSRNEYSETLLYSLAPTEMHSRSFDTDFTFPVQPTLDAGLEVMRETLTSWGVAPSLYVARDGSGLSRNDYVAPDAFIALLKHVWNDARLREPFRSTLPQAAVSGTLYDRMKGTAAAERVWAKTGSMSNVRSLSGYLMTLDNEPIVFSFMATGYAVADSKIDAAMDEALVRLVKFPRELHEE